MWAALANRFSELANFAVIRNESQRLLHSSHPMLQVVAELKTDALKERHWKQIAPRHGPKQL